MSGLEDSSGEGSCKIPETQIKQWLNARQVG